MLINVFGLWLNPLQITRVFDVRDAGRESAAAVLGRSTRGCRVLYGPSQYSDFPDHSAAAVAAEVNRLWLESFKEPA